MAGSKNVDESVYYNCGQAGHWRRDQKYLSPSNPTRQMANGKSFRSQSFPRNFFRCRRPEEVDQKSLISIPGADSDVELPAVDPNPIVDNACTRSTTGIEFAKAI